MFEVENSLDARLEEDALVIPERSFTLFRITMRS
jgi:hypothetical protein